MFLKNQKLIHSIITISLILGSSDVYGDSPSTWTGTIDSEMNRNGNWDNGRPTDGIAIFDGNGDNPPLSNRDSGISFDEMQFTSSTQVSVITGLQTNGAAGVTVNPGITATFDIYEHQPLSYPPAAVTINNGPPGDGGGLVVYNLEAYGQLYTNAGSTGSTVINVGMTGGNNYFEVNGTGNNIFDNVSSADESDEIAIANGSTLIIRGSNINIINGVISGDGALTKSGSGSLILNNDNTYTGGTRISEGILAINGDLPGNVIVDAAGILKGSGSIAGNISLAGTVAPGNSIGTLNVVNLTATSSSVFTFEINSAGASDQIIASGSMTIGGTLNLVPLDLAFTSAKTYSILQSATPISGTFSSIQSSMPALKLLSYLGDSVSLVYLPVASIGLSSNAEAAANCFSSLSGSDANVITAQLLSLSFSDMQTAFNQMQPSQFSAQTWTQLDNTLLVRSSYSKHLREFSLIQNCSDEYQSDFWVDALGQWERQSEKQDQFGYHDWTVGVSLGTDTAYKQFRFGGAASYTYSKVDWDQSAGHGHINSYYGGLYGGWSDGIGYVMFSTLGAYNHYNSSRHLFFGDIDRHANASHHGWELLAGLEGGAYFKAGSFRVGPFGRVDYVYLWQQGYQESGANSLNLHVESRQDQLIQSQAGIVFTTSYECDPERTSGTFTPRLELSYINQTPIARSDYEASFQNSTCEFDVSGWDFERNLGAVGASITYKTASERMGISLQYDGQFGSKYINQSGNLIFNVKY